MIEKSPQLAHDELERLCDVGVVQASGDGEATHIIEMRDAAVDGISQTMFLAQDLEEPRTGVLAEQGVQKAQRKSAFIVARTDANADGELELGGLFGGEADFWTFLVRFGLQKMGALSR